MKRITVQVCSRDRATELCIFLHSLRNQTWQDYDCAILDDAYGQPLTNFKFIQDIITRLKLEGHDVKVLRNNVSFGVCKARQQLIDSDPWPDNDYIFRGDDDTILEKDYLQRLVKVLESDEQVGIASGITPLFGSFDFVREARFVKPVINKIELDKEGSIIKYCDDSGVLYDEEVVLPAHQFRSMALMRRKMFEQGLAYETSLTQTGFREEAFLSLRAAWLGWKCVVDLGAIGFHAPCASGGVRSNPQMYSSNVKVDNDRFMNWAKTTFLEKGVPKVW